MVSFSLTIGTTPMLSSSVRVLTALRYLVRSEMSPLVKRIWAIGCDNWEKRLSQRAIRRP